MTRPAHEQPTLDGDRGHTMEGTLRPVDGPGPGVPVRFHLVDGWLAIEGDTVGDLGAWELRDLAGRATPDGALLRIGGEDLVATFGDRRLERELVEALTQRSRWLGVIPVVGGFGLAAGIWMLWA